MIKVSNDKKKIDSFSKLFSINQNKTMCMLHIKKKLLTLYYINPIFQIKQYYRENKILSTETK